MRRCGAEELLWAATCRPALSWCLKGASSLDDTSLGRALSPHQRSRELSLLFVPGLLPPALSSALVASTGCHILLPPSWLFFSFLSFFLFTSDSNINIKEKKESEVSQSCLTLCGPMDCSPPGSSVHGILQARILEWVAIPFSRASSQPRDPTWVTCIAGRFFTIWATREVSFEELIASLIWCAIHSVEVRPVPQAARHTDEQHVAVFKCCLESQCHRPKTI